MYKYTNKLPQRVLHNNSLSSFNFLKSQNFSQASPAAPQSADIKLEGKYKELIDGLNKDYLKIAEEKEA
jgi:hypothetical protein